MGPSLLVILNESGSGSSDGPEPYHLARITYGESRLFLWDLFRAITRDDEAGVGLSMGVDTPPDPKLPSGVGPFRKLEVMALGFLVLAGCENEALLSLFDLKLEKHLTVGPRSLDQAARSLELDPLDREPGLLDDRVKVFEFSLLALLKTECRRPGSEVEIGFSHARLAFERSFERARSDGSGNSADGDISNQIVVCTRKIGRRPISLRTVGQGHDYEECYQAHHEINS